MNRIILLLILFTSCSKENFDRDELSIYGENRKPKSVTDLKNLQLKTLRQEITYPNSSEKYTYNFQYNKNGTINRIDITRQSGSYLSSYYVAIYGNGIKIDSIVRVPEQGLDQAYKNIEYKGNKITKVDLYNSRAFGIFSSYPIAFEYDKKGNLLNSDPWNHFIYDEEGFLRRVTYILNPNYSVTYSYDNTPNPLYIDNLFLMMINHDYFLKQFTHCRYNVSSKTISDGVIIKYHNVYDQMGRLIKKSYTENQEQFELYFAY